MKIRQLDIDSALSDEHEAAGLPPLEIAVTHPEAVSVRQDFRRNLWFWGLLLGFALLSAWWLPWARLGQGMAMPDLWSDPLFWQSALVGLLAQTIDGALGMAYGISGTTFLLSVGVSPAAASASVHMAEVATTAVSGLAHWRMGNVDRELFRRLLWPGLLGAVTGAYVVTSLDGQMLRPWISGYLLIMGLYILYRALHGLSERKAKSSRKRIGALALTGGFVDAVGGGGWGPVVTSSLLGSGHVPRTTIGSVNAAEFFLAIAGAASFTLLVGLQHWNIILGLVAGGLFAAPLAAVLVRHLHARTLMTLVGVLVTSISAFNLVKSIL